MEIAKYEKDEKSYADYSKELFSLIKNFGKIKSLKRELKNGKFFDFYFFFCNFSTFTFL